MLVAFGPDQRTVAEVRTGRGAQPITKLTKAVGYLIDVDRERPAVQILVNSAGGDHSVLRDWPVGRGATFGLLFRGKYARDVSLEALRRGVKVHSWTDRATGKVVHLQVEMPVLGRRVVKAVDHQRRAFTVEDPDGDRVLKVSRHTRVLTADGPGTLAAVQPAVAVSCGLSPDRQTAEVVHILAK